MFQNPSLSPESILDSYPKGYSPHAAAQEAGELAPDSYHLFLATELNYRHLFPEHRCWG